MAERRIAKSTAHLDGAPHALALNPPSAAFLRPVHGNVSAIQQRANGVIRPHEAHAATCRKLERPRLSLERMALDRVDLSEQTLQIAFRKSFRRAQHELIAAETSDPPVERA